MKRIEAVDNENEKDGEDTFMQSSPYISSSIPQPAELSEEQPVYSICLTREEDLGGKCITKDDTLRYAD